MKFMEVELGVQEPQVPDGTDLETEPLSGQKSSQFLSATAATAKSLQSCSTLCDPETAAHQAPRPCDSQGKNTGVGCHFLLQCMKVKRESEVAQSCPTLSDPMDCSLPGSSVHGTSQARVLEWGAIAFSEYRVQSLLNLFEQIIPNRGAPVNIS